MIAAQLFNQDIRPVYGAVTIGTEWKFLKLVNQTAYIDFDEYYIDRVERIVAILMIPFLDRLAR